MHNTDKYGKNEYITIPIDIGKILTMWQMGNQDAKWFLVNTALSEKRVLQWFFRMVKGSTWNLLLSEPG